MTGTNCIYACRHREDKPLKFKLSIRMEKKDDLSDYKCGMVIGARQVGLSI